ncbi:MAG: ferritin-like domain-containing protein, partial [Acidimicrobiia bacterium]|nr:ferritin-like domain-containing protein [Acidimicrobiia bacterium]
LGADPAAVLRFLNEHQDPGQQVFQTMLFSKIVPNAKKLGLLDAGDGWLRERFTELGVIQFEDWTDTSEEYSELDAVAADRA